MKWTLLWLVLAACLATAQGWKLGLYALRPVLSRPTDRPPQPGHRDRSQPLRQALEKIGLWDQLVADLAKLRLKGSPAAASPSRRPLSAATTPGPTTPDYNDCFFSPLQCVYDL